MTYVTDIFLAQSWRDPRLRLPSNMREDYRILDVEWLHDIWRPDSFFKNAKKVTFHEMSIPNHYLWLYRDKTLLYMAKYDQPNYLTVSITEHFWLFLLSTTHAPIPHTFHSFSILTCHTNFIPFSLHFSFHLLRFLYLPPMCVVLCIYYYFTFVLFVRLTLVLSCAMKFESYPHDTQVCSMLIESRKLKSI